MVAARDMAGRRSWGSLLLQQPSHIRDSRCARAVTETSLRRHRSTADPLGWGLRKHGLPQNFKDMTKPD